MSRRLSFRPEAFADVAEAFSWYQDRRHGLGAKFEAELEATLAILVQAPKACPVVHRQLRRALLKRFPYAVYYGLTPELGVSRG